MMFNDGKGDDDDAAGAAGGAPTEEDLAGRAYHEQLVSTEGQTRDARGRVIFNKDTKRGRARELEGGALVRLFLVCHSWTRLNSSTDERLIAIGRRLMTLDRRRRGRSSVRRRSTSVESTATRYAFYPTLAARLSKR